MYVYIYICMKIYMYIYCTCAYYPQAMSRPSDLKAGDFAVISRGTLKDPKVTYVMKAANARAAEGTRFAGPKFLHWDCQLG